MSDKNNKMFEHIFFRDLGDNDENDLFSDFHTLTSNFAIPSIFPNLLPLEANIPTGPTSSTTNKVHDNNSKDNLLRKIQNHYINFIIDFLNEYLKEKNIDKNLFRLDYSYKKKVNKNFVEELKTKNLRYIIITNISIKYTRHENDANKKCLEEIESCSEINKKNEIMDLKKLLDINYLDFFKKVYYKSNRDVDLKEFGINAIIRLGKKVEMFNDLLNQNKSKGEEHVKNIHKCALKNYFPGYLFYCEN